MKRRGSGGEAGVGGRRGEGREVAARTEGEGEEGGGEGRGGWWGCDAGRGAKGGGEGEGIPGPVYAGVVTGQPQEPEDHLKVTQPGHLEGEILGMAAMDPDPSRQVE